MQTLVSGQEVTASARYQPATTFQNVSALCCEKHAAADGASGSQILHNGLCEAQWGTTASKLQSSWASTSASTSLGAGTRQGELSPPGMGWCFLLYFPVPSVGSVEHGSGPCTIQTRVCSCSLGLFPELLTYVEQGGFGLKGS